MQKRYILVAFRGSDEFNAIHSCKMSEDLLLEEAERKSGGWGIT